MPTYSTTATQLKYASGSSWTSGKARQGVYSTTRYEGAIRFTGLPNMDFSNVAVSQIQMKVTFAAAGGADVRLAEALAVILAAMRCAPFPGFVSSAFAGARTGALAATGLAAMVLAAMVLAATGLAATGLAAAVCALALTGARAEVLATALVVFPAALPAALLAALAPSPAGCSAPSPAG